MQNRTTRAGLVGVLCAAVVALGACSSHPSADEALREWYGAFCQQESTCDAANFAKNYPNGVDQCTNEMVGESNDQIDHDAKEACTTDEVHACTNDIKALDCTGFIVMQAKVYTDGIKGFPASCQKC